MVMELPPDYYEVTALDVSTAVVVVEDDCVRTRDDFPLRNPASNELLVLGKQEKMESLKVMYETASSWRRPDTNAAFNHGKAFTRFYLLLPRVAHLVMQIACVANSGAHTTMNRSANMLASILGIERYPGIAEEILTYTTPAQLGYVVDSLMISNTFPYSNRYFNPIRQLVEDGFTILLISSHFDAPMTRIITQRLKALFGHIGEDAQGHTHAHVRQQAGTLDHVPTQEHRDDRAGMNKTMPPHGLYDVPEGFDEMFGASIGWPASTRPRTLRHVSYSFNHTVMMYQPAFVVVPTNQGSVDIRTRFLRMEWTMRLFERQMRDKVAFVERYLTDDGGMLTFFFKTAPRGTVSFNYIEGLDKRKRMNVKLNKIMVNIDTTITACTSRVNDLKPNHIHQDELMMRKMDFYKLTDGRTLAISSSVQYSLLRFGAVLGHGAMPQTPSHQALQLLLFNEECLVGTSHQLVPITSLPFVHTARRYYRLNGSVRPSDWLRGVGNDSPEPESEPAEGSLPSEGPLGPTSHPCLSYLVASAGPPFRRPPGRPRAPGPAPAEDPNMNAVLKNSVNHRVFERTLRPLVFRGACLSERHCCPQARLVCWAPSPPPGTGPKGSGGTASGPRAYGALSPAL
ncbi:hypothetical protein ALT_4854 [Aspergillus lentulus]|uniref:Uncharacterized protein n=1 Tax=Aspergillus lentulus TaxID=293939 RepID=A0AAN4PJZ5_ASPLE|nr:hypothetical protein ALT_4854 [Aspergillus lentulus]